MNLTTYFSLLSSHRPSGRSAAQAGTNTNETDLIEVDLGEPMLEKAKPCDKEWADDGESVKEEEDMSELSGSEQDEEASAVDWAEQKEKEVRRTLLFAFLSAIGMIFLIKLIGKLIERCTGNMETEAEGATEAANQAVRSSITQSTLTTGNQAAM